MWIVIAEVAAVWIGAAVLAAGACMGVTKSRRNRARRELPIGGTDE